MARLLHPIETYREFARAWCNFAAGKEGRRANDPVYRWLTEGRDRGPSYSSCADLGHWLLYRLGVRSDYINRTEHNGWRSNVNVARLCAKPFGTCPVAEQMSRGAAMRTGDIIIAWRKPDSTDAHVMVVDGVELSSCETLHTWDCGQGPLDPAAWLDGRQHIECTHRQRDFWDDVDSAHEEVTGQRLQDGKVIRSILPLESALSHAATNDELAPVDLPTGERFDALEGDLVG